MSWPVGRLFTRAPIPIPIPIPSSSHSRPPIWPARRPATGATGAPTRQPRVLTFSHWPARLQTVRLPCSPAPTQVARSAGRGSWSRIIVSTLPTNNDCSTIGRLAPVVFPLTLSRSGAAHSSVHLLHARSRRPVGELSAGLCKAPVERCQPALQQPVGRSVGVVLVLRSPDVSRYLGPLSASLPVSLSLLTRLRSTLSAAPIDLWPDRRRLVGANVPTPSVRLSCRLTLIDCLPRSDTRWFRSARPNRLA